MEWTNEQLIETARVVAKYESEKAAQLLNELATRLDCALAATRVACDQRNTLAAENAGLKEALWWLYETVSSDCVSIPNEKYSSVTNAAQVLSETPATDAFLAEVRVHGVTEYASKRGFSFQHGSIHAHFGNGDVMVGAVTFENGDAGINFAPVREKTGGVGTSYEWTRGKTAEQVDSVFVIASSNAEGLEVIREKLSEAIASLRKGVQS